MFNRIRISIIWIRISIILSIFLAIAGLSFINDLEYKTVFGGELKILIPTSFTKTPKKLNYPPLDLSTTMEFYTNKDSTEKILFTEQGKSDIKDLI
jgi:hypothetical protein